MPTGNKHGELKATKSEAPGLSDAKQTPKTKRLLKAQPATRNWGVVTGTLWVMLAYLLPQFVLLPLVDVLRQLPFGNNTKVFLLQGLSQIGALLVLGLVMRYVYRAKLSSIGLNSKQPTTREIGWGLVMFPLYMLTSITFSTLVDSIFHINLDQAQNIGYSNPDALGLVLIFAALVCLTPLTEELLFRGFLFTPFRRAFGFWGGAVIVSVLFALAHGQVNVGVDVFVLSMFLCYLREKTGSLWPGILLHATKNLVAFAVLFIIGVK